MENWRLAIFAGVALAVTIQDAFDIAAKTEATDRSLRQAWISAIGAARSFAIAIHEGNH